MTFVAEPRRRLVLLAKALAVGGAVLVVGLLASVLMFEIASSLLAGNGFNADIGYPDWSLTDPEVLRAVGGTGVYLTAIALLSLGVARPAAPHGGGDLRGHRAAGRAGALRRVPARTTSPTACCRSRR